jgi:hypothetical protein
MADLGREIFGGFAAAGIRAGHWIRTSAGMPGSGGKARVLRVLSVGATSITVAPRRASKGWRRHVRRQKASARA